MKKRQSERGLPLVEVVVLVVCGVLLLVHLFMFHRVRSKPLRLGCGTNLSGLGKAMLVYANDYGDRFPRAGGPNGAWAARLPDWKAQTRDQACGIEPNDPGRASVSASLYLLVKYAEVAPKWFVCPFDEGVTQFRRKRYGVRNEDLIDFWDFGPDPLKHVSYAYHQALQRTCPHAQQPGGHGGGCRS